MTCADSELSLLKLFYLIVHYCAGSSLLCSGFFSSCSGWGLFLVAAHRLLGVSGDAKVKNPPANAGDTGVLGWILSSGRSPGGGNGNPLQYSCLGNPMDRGGWWATVQEVTKSRTGLSTRTHMHTQASYYGGVSCCRAQVLEHGLQ